MNFDHDIAELSQPQTEQLQSNHNILDVILEHDEHQSEIVDNDLDGFTFDGPDPVKVLPDKLNATTDSDGKLVLNTNPVTILESNPVNLEDIAVISVDNKLSNLDPIQLKNIAYTTFVYDDFINSSKLDDLISNYSMPTKAFNHSNECYNSYSMGTKAIMEIKSLPAQPDLNSQYTLTDYEFYYHYQGVIQQTERKPSALVSHLADNDILNQELYFELLVKSDDNIKPIPFRISPSAFLPPGSTTHTFEVTQPFRFYDLIQGDTITVDCSILCLNLTCTREFFDCLISGCSHVYTRNTDSKKLSFKDMSASYQACVDTTKYPKQLFGLSNSEINTLDAPNSHQPPLTKSALTNGSIGVTYNVTAPSYKDLEIKINEYAAKIIKEFEDYQSFDRTWVFHMVKYSIFAAFIKKVFPRFNACFENPFHQYPITQEQYIYRPIINAVSRSLITSPDGRFVLDTNTKSVYSLVAQFTLNTDLIKPLKPSKDEGQHNFTSINDIPETQTFGNGQQVSSAVDLKTVIDQLRAELTNSNKKDTPLDNERGNPTSGNLTNLNLIHHSEFDPASPEGTSDSHIEHGAKMTYTINDPRLFYTVAGFPVFHPSVIQTISPSDLASLSLGYSALPTNLASLPIDSYAPLLPFKSHKITIDRTDHLFLQIFSLFVSCEIKNDFPAYSQIDCTPSVPYRSDKSYGSMYFLSRGQYYKFERAVAKCLSVVSTDVHEYINTMFSSLLNTNFEDSSYVCYFLQERSSLVERNHANIDLTNVKKSLTAIYSLVPSKYLDPLSYISRLNARIQSYSLAISKSYIDMVVTLNSPEPDPFAYFLKLHKSNTNLTSRFDIQLFCTLVGLHCLYSSKILDKMNYLNNLMNVLYIDTFCRSYSLTVTKISDAPDDPKLRLTSDLTPINIISYLTSILLTDLLIV